MSLTMTNLPHLPPALNEYRVGLPHWCGGWPLTGQQHSPVLRAFYVLVCAT